MANTTQKTARIVAVMKKLHRLEELHKIDLQRQFNDLRRSEEAIIGNLNKEDIPEGFVLNTSNRYLRTLAKEAERVSKAQAQQSKTLQERAGKVRQAEKLHDTVSRRTTHAEHEKHLTEVIELYAGKRSASLP